MLTLVQVKVFVNLFARSILLALTPHLWRKCWHSFLSVEYATCVKSHNWHTLPMARLFHLLFGFNTCLHKRPLSYLRINSNLNKINLPRFWAWFLFCLNFILFWPYFSTSWNYCSFFTWSWKRVRRETSHYAFLSFPLNPLNSIIIPSQPQVASSVSKIDVQNHFPCQRMSQ